MRLRSKVSMAGPNFSVNHGQEFEFENQEQIGRWLAAGYVEVVEIPGGGRRLENAGARTARTDAGSESTSSKPAEQAATGEGAKTEGDGGKTKDEAPKTTPAAKPTGKGNKSKK